jgi:elongator complex protein 1
LAVDSVVSLHHFSDSLTTCVVLAGGDIITVQEAGDGFPTPEGPYIEIVGSIDAGIAAARWSPDEELLVIATNASTVVFMSRSFDGVAEATMTAADLMASKHVSVGWGKKETQFQGRGAKAKALRDPTIPEKVDEGAPSPDDDGRATISWRGDGAYVAINSVEAGLRRAIRVYNREGVLDGASEPVDGLEGSLSWRPAGNLMAGIQRYPDHVDVVFFERNGLRHGQFTLRVPQDRRGATERISLEWNSDSTVLAVLLRDRMQLWTMGNYHWYLKQEIFAGPREPSLIWHPEKALRFAAVSSGMFPGRPAGRQAGRQAPLERVLMLRQTTCCSVNTSFSLARARSLRLTITALWPSSTGNPSESRPSGLQISLRPWPCLRFQPSPAL